MKIVVMGCGGVGGFYGGRLAHAGCDVTFIARGAQLAALRARGLTIESEAQGGIHLPRVKATDDPNAAGGADLVIVAVKLWAMDAALQAVRPVVGPRTAVLSLQNGVVKDDILKREFGEPAVIGGAAYVAAQLAAPGVIRQTGTLQRVVLGEYDGRRTPRVEALAEAFARAGVQTEVSPDIRRALWEKFVFLVGLSATTATMRMPIGPIRSNPQTRAFLLDILKETVAVGRALGVALPESYAEERLAFADSVPADMTSSMHHDLERGNPLEVEWLSGSVVTLGAQAGVPTPANRAVWDILALHARGRRG
ncbi:MAG TPA: ketopantoate reductase family protein [Burkholderiales bacterium]|nr:ketopantoate reductase family protein [Burkholderiales bacterium]